MLREPVERPPGAPERMAGTVPGVKAAGFLFFSAIRERQPVHESIERRHETAGAPGFRESRGAARVRRRNPGPRREGEVVSTGLPLPERLSPRLDGVLPRKPT